MLYSLGKEKPEGTMVHCFFIKEDNVGTLYNLNLSSPFWIRVKFSVGNTLFTILYHLYFTNLLL